MEQRASSEAGRLLLTPVSQEGYEHSPHGVVVCHTDGRVLDANGHAQKLLGERLTEAPAGARCCDVLDCGELQGLHGSCLTRSASIRTAPLHEVALRGGTNDGAPTLFASAAGAGDWVVITLRPAAADRLPGSGALLRVVTLGHTRLERAAGVDDGEWLGQRPGTLLKLLVARRPRVLHAEEIADTLWPHSGPTAMGNVRHFVHALREHLDPGREKHSRASFLRTRNGGYALDLSLVTIDADEFEAHVAAGVTASEAGETDEAVAHLEQGLSMYGGDFLEDDLYADWALTERDRLRALAVRALETLGAVHLATRNLEEVQAALQRLAELEPFDVRVHRRLIALDLRMGRRGQAVRRYDALRRRLRRTFDEGLDFTLADLAQRTNGDAPGPRV